MASRRSSSCDLEILPHGARVFDHQSHWQLKLQAFDRAFVWHWIPRKKKNKNTSGRDFSRPQDMNQRHACIMFLAIGLSGSFYDYMCIYIYTNIIKLHPSSFFKFCLFGMPACPYLSSSTCHIDCNTSVSSRQIKKSYARPSSSWCLPSSV